MPTKAGSFQVGTFLLNKRGDCSVAPHSHFSTPHLPLHRGWHGAALGPWPEPPWAHGWVVAVVTHIPDLLLCSRPFQPHFSLWCPSAGDPMQGSRELPAPRSGPGDGMWWGQRLGSVSCLFSQGSQIPVSPTGRGPAAAWTKHGLLLWAPGGPLPGFWVVSSQTPLPYRGLSAGWIWPSALTGLRRLLHPFFKGCWGGTGRGWGGGTGRGLVKGQERVSCQLFPTVPLEGGNDPPQSRRRGTGQLQLGELGELGTARARQTGRKGAPDFPPGRLRIRVLQGHYPGQLTPREPQPKPPWRPLGCAALQGGQPPRAPSLPIRLSGCENSEFAIRRKGIQVRLSPAGSIPLLRGQRLPSTWL